MSITIFEACKKRVRKPKIYGFHTFADPGCPIHFSGPFRDNIRVFVQECGEIEQYQVEGMPTWCTMLVNENNGVALPLFTVEESVKYSRRPFCDHCRCAGWSHHFVSKRRYHLIIPIDDEWNRPLEGRVFDLQTHLLHGLIHCNGFGHLLCINGLEGGSKSLCGREIMDLWDRICTQLRTRKITVVDLSKKRSMDLRLLHGVAYGHPWFGRWGYKFHRGSFGVAEHQYNRAIEILSSLNLDQILYDFNNTAEEEQLKAIIRTFRDASETKLITLRDLLRFMLALKARAPVQRKTILSTATTSSWKPSMKTTIKRRSPPKEKPVKLRKFSPFAANAESRWPSRRLEFAAEVIVEALKEKKATDKGQGGMSRQEVRDAARLQIGDTGLLDFVLKSLNNFIVGDYVVRRAINPSTRVLEYTIDEVVDGAIAEEGSKVTPVDHVALERATFYPPVPYSLAGSDVYADILFLYRTILEGYPETELMGLATRIVLDCKHFVKEWYCNDEADALLRFECVVSPSSTEMELLLTRPLPPGELVVLQPYATVGELKTAVEMAMRDTYCLMGKFEAMEVEGLGELENGEVLFGAVESGAQVWVKGSGIELGTELRYEGGADNWTVDCSCGAKDDDGERMVACDICEVWQHTRCGGIEDSEAPPLLFVCERCRTSLMPQMNGYDVQYSSNGGEDYLLECA
ncbi:PHD finger protein MALE MEIOCYTE DEATH 1 [Macadamia integrifolia]|uniref:PHD finger protein MALE MEIOCYTE DEATH 1 n=1 Tax=Macadamia integrifolia TaxID=60698 RepID=UPI001C4F8C6A|nr:PHD finger protein MALE MEIOCYTE DEATH 1 [Macadamia integrifolia]